MKLQLYIFLILLFFIANNSFAQFPPPAGQEGSTAIHKDSAVFIDWATYCVVERGYLDISQPDLGFVDFGVEENAIGAADNTIISLGDGGMATVSFDVPIANGEGFDFAIFENSFLDTFLELAFVEVSSDGENFFRFDGVSLTQTDEQVGGFGELNTEKINNLAGKYRIGYGTPFDLEELDNISGLNIDSVTFIRIIDVVGSIQDEYATYDSQENKINDPWPTPFPSGGFDLDAVGVIHNIDNLSINERLEQQIMVYPNPIPKIANCFFVISPESMQIYDYSIISLDGRVIHSVYQTVTNCNKIIIDTEMKTGLYILKLNTDKGVIVKKIIKN